MIKPTKATRSQEKEALIEFNRQRKKNMRQLNCELDTLDKIYSERAKKRQEEAAISTNLKLGNKSTLVATLPQPNAEETGKTRDKLAEKADKADKIAREGSIN